MKSYEKVPDMAVDDETKSTNNNKQKQIEKKGGGSLWIAGIACKLYI